MPGTGAPRTTGVVEGVAGLLSAGLLVLSLVLVVLVFAAPAVAPGSGISAANGPNLDRVLVSLIVGLAGEVLHLQRTRLAIRFRPIIAGGVIVAVLGALWWGWWR